MPGTPRPSGPAPARRWRVDGLHLRDVPAVRTRPSLSMTAAAARRSPVSAWSCQPCWNRSRVTNSPAGRPVKHRAALRFCRSARRRRAPPGVALPSALARAAHRVRAGHRAPQVAAITAGSSRSRRAVRRRSCGRIPAPRSGRPRHDDSHVVLRSAGRCSRRPGWPWIRSMSAAFSPQIEPGGGLVEAQQLRLGGQRPAISKRR